MSIDLLILTSILLWGAWGIFEKKALGVGSAQEICIVLFALSVCHIPFLILLLNMSQEKPWHLTPEIMLWSGVSGFGYVVAVLSYLFVLKHVDASYVYGITAGYPVVAVVGAIFILGEPFVLWRFLGILVAVLGIYAIGVTPPSEEFVSADASRVKVMFLLSLTILGFGLRGVVDKIAISYGEPLEIYLGKCIWDILYLSIVVAIFKAKQYPIHLNKMRMWSLCLLSSLCLTIGGLAYLNAMKECSVSYVVGITSCYPLVMYVLALVFLKEKFNWLRLSGIVLLIVGLVTVRLS